ncbi:DUF6923 family protein [Actinoplanes sp. NPDC049668]|uniref:DUF6923 family protein n=1 Tax=unclassified Actinoplanes TaxID=2626549 RepID=UPI0033AC62F9
MTTLALLSATAVLAGFVVAPPAHAAGLPAVSKAASMAGTERAVPVKAKAAPVVNQSLAATPTGSLIASPVSSLASKPFSSGWDLTVSPAVTAAPIPLSEMEAGELTTVTANGVLGPASDTNGVAVLGGYAYLNKGTQLLKVNKASGASSVVAGVAGSASCQNGSTGDQVRFKAITRVVGADGRFVYLIDGCGLRRIDPATGAGSTIAAQPSSTNPWQHGTIAGKWLYLITTNAIISRFDLTSGSAPTLLYNNLISGYNAIAADDTYLYGVGASNGSLYRIDPVTGTHTLITNTLNNLPIMAMVSVGGYLYAAFRDTYGSTALSIVRINKTDGTTLLVSPTGTGTTGLSGVTGLAAADDKLYVADGGADGAWLKALTPVAATPVTAPASAPVMEAGAVSSVTADGALGAAPPTRSSGVST